jgi:hypothetical protein
MHHENTSHCLSSSLDALEAFSLQTLTLQIAQPQSKLRCNLVLLTVGHLRGSLACPVRGNTLHRRVWTTSSAGQFLFQGVQTLVELMIAWLLLD